MNNRQKRANLGKEALAILESGSYQSHSGQIVQISDMLQPAINGSKLYRPDEFDVLRSKLTEIGKTNQTRFEVTNETTLAAAERLVENENTPSIVALNFASARNPGGGFLGGSQAQEESLARSSGLYPCINQMTEMAHGIVSTEGLFIYKCVVGSAKRSIKCFEFKFRAE
ncbi:MAG: TIGR02452 family protein, partial [Chloroflexi bacterium]|nr:TIGR02452 family protein [Chloroflexota bacterium]